MSCNPFERRNFNELCCDVEDIPGRIDRLGIPGNRPHLNEVIVSESKYSTEIKIECRDKSNEFNPLIIKNKEVRWVNPEQGYPCKHPSCISDARGREIKAILKYFDKELYYRINKKESFCENVSIKYVLEELDEQLILKAGNDVVFLAKLHQRNNCKINCEENTPCIPRYQVGEKGGTERIIKCNI